MSCDDSQPDMKILRAENYVTVPWRNGGGTTQEIAAYRDPRLHSDFLWRLSIATVAQSGPFSRFDGIDRTIALLEGEGMLLHAPTGTTPLMAATPPFSFRGETEISCELIAGATIDFNVMTRREFYRHTLRRERFSGRAIIKGAADMTFVVSNSFLELSSCGLEYLRPLDIVADMSPGTAIELSSDHQTEVFIVELMAQ
jgi:uncharacterized protein